MIRSRRFLTSALFSLASLVLWPGMASACSVCMGATSKSGPAANGAIFLMLGFLVIVLGSIGAFMFNLAKRARSPLPPHAEISQMTTGPEDTK